MIEGLCSYLWERCVKINFFTLAFLAIFAASHAVKCLYSAAFCFSSFAKVASAMRMSEFKAIFTAFSLKAVSNITATFLPFFSLLFFRRLLSLYVMEYAYVGVP